MCPNPFPPLLLQFDCTNTLNDQLLERVTVQMEPSDSYDVICCIPAPSLAYNQPGICYTLVRIPQDDPTAGEKSQNSLKWNFWGAPRVGGAGFGSSSQPWMFLFCVSRVLVFSRIIFISGFYKLLFYKWGVKEDCRACRWWKLGFIVWKLGFIVWN